MKIISQTIFENRKEFKRPQKKDRTARNRFLTETGEHRGGCGRLDKSIAMNASWSRSPDLLPPGKLVVGDPCSSLVGVVILQRHSTSSSVFTLELYRFAPVADISFQHAEVIVCEPGA